MTSSVCAQNSLTGLKSIVTFWRVRGSSCENVSQLILFASFMNSRSRLAPRAPSISTEKNSTTEPFGKVSVELALFQSATASTLVAWQILRKSRMAPRRKLGILSVTTDVKMPACSIASLSSSSKMAIVLPAEVPPCTTLIRACIARMVSSAVVSQ